ncbi:MAG: hypothetical protein RL885_31720 [Planctomycetota bacterium]
MPQEPYHFPGQGIEVLCPCSHQFRVPTSLRGGIVNCPSCQKAVDVPRGSRPEFLFWLCIIGLAVPFVLFAVISFAGGHFTAGWVTIGLGVLVIGGMALMM